MAASRALGDWEKGPLLKAREAVWRAYFAGDRATLEKLLPEELITLEAGGDWGNRKAVFDGSARFAAGSGKRSTHTGRVTEVFVDRNGTWVNPSWHMNTGR